MRHKHEGIYSIDFYAYSSQIKSWNSKFKILLSFSTLLFCVSASNIYVSLSVIISMSLITVCLGKLDIKQYLSLLTIPFAFMFMGSIAIAIEFAYVPKGEYFLNFNLFYIYVTKEGIFKTIEVMTKALAAVCAMYMMVLSTPTSEIITVLRKLHIPKLIIELMNMIYRFIFILIDIQFKMKCSAQSRLGYCSFKSSCFSFGNTAGNLLIVSLKKANTYYDALVSRCYNGELLFLEEYKEVHIIQIVLAVIYFIALLFIWIVTR